MGLQVKSGTFQQPAANGSQGITGVGFLPTALILWSAGDFNNGSWRASYEICLGIASGAGSQFSIAAGAFDSGSNRCRQTGQVVATSIQGNASVVGVGTLASFDSDGFTLTWSSISGGNRYYQYLALAGVAAQALAWDVATSTGNQTVTGVGFKPDLVIHTNGFITAGYGGTTDSIFAQGAMESGGTQWSSALALLSSGNNQWRRQRTDSTLCLMDAAGNDKGRAAFVSMDNDGFTVSWATAPSSTLRTHSLCLQGLNAKCGSFSKSTSAAPASQTVTGAGFTPAGLWLSSWEKVASTSTDSLGGGLANGFAHSSDGGHSLYSGATSGNHINTFNRSSNLIGITNTGSQALDAEASLTSLDADGFTLNWTTNNGTATEVLYLAMGVVPSAAIPSPQETVAGPPLAGSPWRLLRPFTIPGRQVFPGGAAPVVQPVIAPRETVGGPPLRGAPWQVLRPFRTPGRQIFPGGLAPVVPLLPVLPLETTGGPPLPGSPWVYFRPFKTPGRQVFTRGRAGPPKPGDPGGPPTVASGQPRVSRVPVMDPRRLARFTEQVSSIINSLIAQGILVQTGPDSWTLKLPPP